MDKLKVSLLVKVITGFSLELEPILDKEIVASALKEELEKIGWNIESVEVLGD